MTVLSKLVAWLSVLALNGSGMAEACGKGDSITGPLIAFNLE